MKIAHIAPACYFGVTTESAFKMALGQYLLSDPEYAKLIRRNRELTGSFVMIDNGAAEGMVVNDFEELVTRTWRFADEYVLPDVLFDAEQTVAATLKGAEFVQPHRRAICPQGNSPDEWLQCWRHIDMDLQGRYRTICLPKHMERFDGGRGELFLQVLQALDRSYMYDFHLLGIATNPIQEIQNFRDRVGEAFHVVRSLDTGAALAWAQWEARVDETDSERFSLEWDDEADPEVRQLAQINARSIMAVAS